MVDDRLDVATALLIPRDLPIGARAFLENLERVLDILPASELVDDVADEPFDQLANQLARRQLTLLPEVDQLAVQPITHRTPLVLVDELRRVNAERDVVA